MGSLIIVGFWLLNAVPSATASWWARADTIWNQVDAQGRKHGYWKKNHRNSHRRYIAQFEHGKPVGVSVRYSPSGRVLSRLAFEPDGRRAHAELYDDRGRIQAKGDFYDEVKDGRWEYFNGRRSLGEENWKRGLKHGVFVVLSDLGKPVSRENWKDGRQDGLQQLYYGNGRVRMEWTMRNGFEEGKAYTFYPDGYVRLEGMYRRGNRVGQWIYRDESGRKARAVEYRNGQLVGDEVDGKLDSALVEWEKNKGRIKEPSLDDVQLNQPH